MICHESFKQCAFLRSSQGVALTACTLLPMAMRWLATYQGNTPMTLAMKKEFAAGITKINIVDSLGGYTLGLVMYLIFAKCHIYLMFWFCKSLCVVLHNVIKDNIFWTLLLVVFLHVVVADNRFIKLFYQTRPLSAPFLFRTYFVFSQSRWLD